MVIVIEIVVNNIPFKINCGHPKKGQVKGSRNRRAFMKALMNVKEPKDVC